MDDLFTRYLLFVNRYSSRSLVFNDLRLETKGSQF